MADIYDFPSSFDDQVRMKNATHWRSSISFVGLTAGKAYKLFYNEKTEEYYILDDKGRKYYDFYLAFKGELI